MTIKCYDFFGCKKTDKCPFFSYEGGENCWEVKPSLTPFVGVGDGIINEEDKLVCCENCLYYEYVHKIKEE